MANSIDYKGNWTCSGSIKHKNLSLLNGPKFKPLPSMEKNTGVSELLKKKIACTLIGHKTKWVFNLLRENGSANPYL